ncbi:ribosome-associated translation inhibitor RaiA [Brevibacillus ruminantium]|uniref:Ribosome hibernation promoting factor n=1 Tax=Brevibacillus ruminantium TaxID=2950604 RepID=A0ABY4WH59_9BACL|nr:ribosome-associated translation inhibitor RaiA [Brevibacillus ruminantium]USG66204.1 ribosome-associated translation inhibitor RaiA [Brevibacillus ruminantium]
MNCTIHGEHLTVTPALQEYVEQKLLRLEKFDLMQQATDCRVTLRVVRKQHTVEVTIPVGGMIFRAEESSDDMYASIDGVVDKLNRQIRKYKNRAEQRGKTGYDQHFNSAADAEESERVVRMKEFEFKPMDVEEAVMQMELLGHSFFVFTNQENLQVNVVYKRNDGNYGLIAQAR